MSKATALQREQRREREGVVIDDSRSVEEIAADAWQVVIMKNQRTLADLCQRILGRGVDRFVEPIKGRRVAAEIGELLLGLAVEKERSFLCLITECPSCKEADAYRFASYAELGALLANAKIDPRCHRCVNYQRGTVRSWL